MLELDRARNIFMVALYTEQPTAQRTKRFIKDIVSVVAKVGSAGPAGLEQADRGARIFGQPVRKQATDRPTANDYVVVSRAVREL